MQVVTVKGLAILLTAQAHSSQKPQSSVSLGEKAWSTVARGSTLSFLTTWRAVPGCHLARNLLFKTLGPEHKG